VALEVHVGPCNDLSVGDLDNCITGLLVGLQAAHANTPWREHAAWPQVNAAGIAPDRVIAIEVVEIQARKIIGDTEEPWYEVSIEGEEAGDDTAG